MCDFLNSSVATVPTLPTLRSQMVALSIPPFQLVAGNATSLTSDDSSAVWVLIGVHFDCAIAALVDFVLHCATAMIFPIKDTLAVLQDLLQKQARQVQSSPERQDPEVHMNQSDVEFQVTVHQNL